MSRRVDRDIRVSSYLTPVFKDYYNSTTEQLKEYNTFLPQEQLLAQSDTISTFKRGFANIDVPRGYVPLIQAAEIIDQDGKTDGYDNVFVEDIGGYNVFIDKAILQIFSLVDSTVVIIANDFGVFLRLTSKDNGNYSFAIHKYDDPVKSAIYYYITK